MDKGSSHIDGIYSTRAKADQALALHLKAIKAQLEHFGYDIDRHLIEVPTAFMADFGYDGNIIAMSIKAVDLDKMPQDPLS